MPTPSSTRTRGRRPAAVVTPVETDTVEPVIEPVGTDTQENPNVSTETATAEATETGSVVANKPGRKPMDQAERQKRATYRACEGAAKLLKDNGFSVEYPSTWENPEADRLRASAKRAIEALEAAGIDPSTLLSASDAEPGDE